MTDSIRLDPSSLAELERLGRSFKDAGPVIQSHLRDGLRSTEKAVTGSVIREGAAGLPRRGGLRARVSAARGTLRTELFGGRSIRFIFEFTDKQRDALQGLEDGVLHHPVFGHWRAGTPTQRVSPHRFSQAFLKQQRLLQSRSIAALDAAVAELARKA